MDNTTPHGCVEMVWAGRSASRAIDDSDAPDPGGGHHPAWRQPKDGTHRPRWTPNAQGFPALGSLTPAEEKRRDRSVLDSGTRVVARNSMMESISRSERDGGHMAPLGRNVGVLRRGMRPAGVSGPARRMAPVADVPVPTAAGVTFSAVAEVHASSSVIDDDILVVQASEQHTVCSTDPGKVPETLSIPAGGHTRHRAVEAFSSEDRPGRYTYGGDSGPGAVSAFGSGRISGQ